MTKLDPHIIAAFFSAGREADPEAGLGHDYDGPELRSGTPEYEALYAEYQAWADQPEPEAEPEWGCEDSNAYQARVEAGLEPEAGT
jgi:hypothetical protein